MGQGYSLTTLSAGSAGIDAPELADLTYEKSLGNARFMKSIRARHKDGLVVVKVTMKPYARMKLDKYVKTLLYERKVLDEVPNALAYHRIVETSTNGFLVRQYIHSSLYDRISTRPFLEDIEKKWLSFQLLCAVRDCHARNLYHGDIKTENVLVTSWNWLYLSDFSSSFKPTYLPEDNPADFSFYFDTSGRRTCYLAPERFLDPGTQTEVQGRVNWAMDIFSVGCVIAELFLETPIFSLSQLFKYRKGEYEPEHTFLSRIEDKNIREMVTHMIQLDPEARYSAEEYLNFWRHKAFPDYFYGFLHQYMHLITDPTSGRTPVTAGAENLGESDDRIDRVYYDFDKISYFLGHERGTQQANPQYGSSIFPLYVDIPNNRHPASATVSRTVDDGTLIFLTLIVSSLRSTARATARVHACELLLAFAERVTDEAKLDRIVPYVMTLLADPSEIVKVSAVRTLTQVLALVSVVSPINAYIFPEYILPRLQPFVPGAKQKPSSLVRATYASCMASLASTASRFLDMMQALRADGSLPTNDPEAEEDGVSQSVYHTLFDVAREDLLGQFESQTKAFLTDDDPAVRRAFLGSVPILCVFFGSTRANDVVISHLITYLNDRDWMLKCAFFETIVGVATYIGGSSLEEFILPLMVQALTDPEEFVVERILRSFSAIAQLGLFQRSKTWELVDVVGRFTMHPNLWVREAATQFISAATTYLSIADRHCIIIPLIRPYLRVLPTDLSELRLLDALKKPIPRLLFDMASTWAMQAEKSLFWRPVQQLRTFSFGGEDDTIPTVSAKDLGHKALSRIPKNEEDEQWLNRLRSAGMSTEDEFKLVALREYIWRVVHRKAHEDVGRGLTRFAGIIALTDLGITPQTVFFDHSQNLLDHERRGDANKAKQRHTIADALLDASTTVDDALARRKQSHLISDLDRRSHDDLSGTRRKSPSASPSPRGKLNGTQGSPVSGAETIRQQLQVPGVQSSGAKSAGHASSIDSESQTKLGEHNHVIQHKGSAINLMNKGDQTNKATAETSTTSANVFGKVDGGSSRGAAGKRSEPSALALAKEDHRLRATEAKYQAAHSYTGNDPSVLKLLDSLYLENYPLDYVEFGPLVTPLSGRQPIKRVNGQATSSPWRPEGTLVAVFGEHTSGINRVVVAPDHLFFLTGSEDGSVKIWDSARLEKNVAHRARQTHKHAAGAKVSSLCFVENTHCFVSTGTDGSVNVVKVDCAEAQGGRRYKIQLLREYQLPDGQHAVWSEHFKNDNQSVLIMATNTSRIVALDLRTMDVLYELHNPLHHGTPICFCVSRGHHWLLLGTSHGVLDLWDLRFHIRLKGWGFSGGSPIHRICLQPVKGRRHRVSIAGGTGQGEVTVWDLEKVLCKEVYRTGVSKENTKGYHLLDIDEEGAGGMLGRFATSLEPSSSASVDRGVRALTMGAHVPEDGSDPRHFFFLSAGPDWKVRFWDTTRFEASTIVSGLELDEGKPTYQVSQPGTELIIVSEKLTPPPEPGAKGSTASDAAATGSKASSNSSAKRGARGPSRSSVISLQQQHLLKSHLDTIQDVALLEYPYGMVVSVDRSGVVYVFS